MVCDNVMITLHFYRMLKVQSVLFVVRKRMKKNETMVLHNCPGTVQQVNKMTPLRQAIGLRQYINYSVPLESFHSTTIPTHLIVLCTYLQPFYCPAVWLKMEWNGIKGSNRFA